jgi:hypothetical protein
MAAPASEVPPSCQEIEVDFKKKRVYPSYTLYGTGEPHLIKFEPAHHGTAAGQSLLYRGVTDKGPENNTENSWIIRIII